MSPEQVRGDKLYTRSDRFSFGVVLYEMTTGRMAFSGITSGVIFDGILNRAPVSPSHLKPNLPARLEEVINKAIEKDRNVRYQHASDILADLKRLKRDLESDKSPILRTPSQRANHKRLPFAGLAILVVACAGYADLSGWRNNNSPSSAVWGP
jgi:serine/threonine protein kinase